MAQVPEGKIVLMEVFGQEVHLEFSCVIMYWVGAIKKAGQASVDVAGSVADFASDQLAFFIKKTNGQELEIWIRNGVYFRKEFFIGRYEPAVFRMTLFHSIDDGCQIVCHA